MVEMMIAKISDNKVVVENERDANKLSMRGYGRLLDDRNLELHPAEALYLMERRKIRILDGKILEERNVFDMFSLFDKRFGQKFLVYRDLRRRGYKIRCFHDLKDRGVDYSLKPKRMDQRDIFVVCASEREDFLMGEMISYISYIDPLIEELWTGIVDEEGDVTYYKIEEIDPKGKLSDVENIRCDGTLLKNLVVVKAKEGGKRLFEEGFYGNLSDGELTLSLLEALHLVERGVLNVRDNKKSLTFDELLEVAKTYQPDIEIRYRVYKDLKNRNICAKTGYKFGTHFRAYERDPKRYHAEYLIDAVESDFKSSWSTISRGVRLAHSVRKVYVLAVVSGKVRYIALERIRP